MPTGAEKVYEAEMTFNESEGEDIDLQLKAGIEGAVIRWASMISEVLKQSSTIAFAGGKHPTPYREIEFWNARLKNLECIYDQLRDPRVKKMARYLEITDSSYLPCFKTLFKNVVAAVIEARDITVYLKPMVSCFSKFEEADLTENDVYVKPLLHCCGLLWAHSRYYCSSAKITTLFQEISNLLIEAAQRQLDIPSMFQAELEDGYAKIDQCIKILELFMDSFEVVRANLASYFPTEVEPQPWTFHPRNIFQRLMDFTERLRLVRKIFQTSVEFLKLEKVEVAGIRGRALSQKIIDVLDEFQTLFQLFFNIKYEILDPEDDGIYADNKIFEDKCMDLDKKLAAVLSQSFDECYNIESMLKFIAVMSNLLERSIINAEVSPKFPRLVEALNRELDTVKLLYDEGMANGPPVEKFYPPTAARMTWIYKLRHRILKPCEDFRELQQDVVKSEDAVHMLLKLDEMLEILDQEQYRVLMEWAASVPDICSVNLMKPPLVRGPNKLLVLNFDPQLTALLREIRYLKVLNIENIPDEAREVFERNEDFHHSILNLTRTVEWYNHLRQNTLPVEFALIQQEIEKIDDDLEEVLTAINWTMDSKLIIKLVPL